MRRLPELKEALQAGHLTATSGVMPLIKNLVWRGYVDEATEVLELADRLADDPGGEGVAEVRALQRWLSVLCPPFHRRMFGDAPLDVADEIGCAAIAAQPRLHAATLPCPSYCGAANPSRRWSAPRMYWRCPA
ncbi:hypothetical protein AB0K02_09520 [Streptomyces sp. NPDC049597]|uniref:hypothetical protein n=1 Tax=Streptomyces sp. NPDC049597 TaxID=3155276 RepID=UPI00342E50D9